MKLYASLPQHVKVAVKHGNEVVKPIYSLTQESKYITVLSKYKQYIKLSI